MENDREKSSNSFGEGSRHVRPLTSFGIEDILNHKASARDRDLQSSSAARPSLLSGLCPPKPAFKGRSPIHALENYVLANTDLGALEESALKSDSNKKEKSAASKKNACNNMCGSQSQSSSLRKRKSRTNFNNHQLNELEKRFLYQKYLTPTDRDEIAQKLGLASSQVITWFQNRRAKLKRDLEEIRADVTASRSISGKGGVLMDNVNMDLETLVANGGRKNEDESTDDGHR